MIIVYLAIYALFIIILAIIVGRYLKKNMITDIAPDSTEKYFEEQEKDRTFPQHNMDGEEGSNSP
jgi:hypothetical protein